VVAQTAGYANEKAAHKAVSRLFQRAVRESVAEALELELMRLDQASRALYKEVLNGNAKAIGAYLKVSDRRMRLLGINDAAISAVAREREGRQAAEGGGQTPVDAYRDWPVDEDLRDAGDILDAEWEDVEEDPEDDE